MKAEMLTIHNSMLGVDDVLNTLQYFEEPQIRRFFAKSANKFKRLAASFFGFSYGPGVVPDYIVEKVIAELVKSDLAEEE